MNWIEVFHAFCDLINEALIEIPDGTTVNVFVSFRIEVQYVFIALFDWEAWGAKFHSPTLEENKLTEKWLAN